jgi:hypothetical protein
MNLLNPREIKFQLLLVKNAFGSDAEGTLARWRQWRAQHGEPGFGVPAPFGGRLMGGGGGGGPQIALSGPGPVYFNDHPVTADDEPQQRISDGDVLRTTKDRLQISAGFRISLWAGENSSVRIASTRPPLPRIELIAGTAVLEQSGGPYSASLAWRDATIWVLAKFDRGKTDSFGLWRVWRSVNKTPQVFTRPGVGGWPTGPTPLP